MQILLRAELLEVLVAGEDLVGPLARQHHLDVPGGELDEDIVGDRAPHELDSGVFVASANQLGDYEEALFATPGHVYGPVGLRASRSTGPRSTCNLDPSPPGRWRGLYGNTFIEGSEAASADEEPLEACS